MKLERLSCETLSLRRATVWISLCFVMIVFAQFFLKNRFDNIVFTSALVFAAAVIFYEQVLHMQELENMAYRLKILTKELEESNKKINNALNRSAYEMLALVEFTTEVGKQKTMNLQESLDKMTDILQHIFNFDACAIFLCDNKYDVVITSVERGFYGYWPERIPLNDFFAKDVLQNNSSFFINDIKNEGEKLNWTFGDEYSSVLVLPLNIKKDCLGMLLIAKKDLNAFTADILRLISIIGNEAAIAIQNQSMYEKVYYSSITDGLTGLYNHSYFSEQIKNIMRKAKQNGKRINLVLMDMDFFKTINDTYGHLVGDAVLRGVAKILKEILPQNCFLARYGGEEFVFLIPEVSENAIEKLVEKLRSKIAENIFEADGEQKFSITASFGIAAYPSNEMNHRLSKLGGESNVKFDDFVNQLIDLADDNLYQAKSSGRNKVCALF